MKFIDTAKIFVKSGKGGPGCVSMRREKYIRFGGPDGGDGGKGGDVYIQGDQRLTSLYDLRLHPHQKAGAGSPGMGSQKTGKSGDDRTIFVPLGTTIIDNATDEIQFDILNEEPQLLLKGGKGGLGNMHFKSAVNQAPRHAQPGEDGMEMCIRLELKLIADVGLVGLPNAGKSTLISVISNAKPKIADYPFTTIKPNLGVVKVDDFSSFIVADIPGIIKNAHQGAGLGDQFLRHIKRTSVLAFLIDVSVNAELDPFHTLELINNELKQYSAELMRKKHVLLLTKIDALNPEIELDNLMRLFSELGEEVYSISSVARIGLDKLVFRLAELVVENKTMLESSTLDTTHE